MNVAGKRLSFMASVLFQRRGISLYDFVVSSGELAIKQNDFAVAVKAAAEVKLHKCLLNISSFDEVN